MRPWQGYAHAGVVVLSVWLCRETIFEALQWWHGRPPSDGLLLGSCILLAGFSCLPILVLHFSHVMVIFPFFSPLFCFHGSPIKNLAFILMCIGGYPKVYPWPQSYLFLVRKKEKCAVESRTFCLQSYRFKLMN